VAIRRRGVRSKQMIEAWEEEEEIAAERQIQRSMNRDHTNDIVN